MYNESIPHLQQILADEFAPLIDIPQSSHQGLNFGEVSCDLDKGCLKTSHWLDWRFIDS